MNPLATLVRGIGEVAQKGKPFYSPIDKAISEIVQTKGTGDQMLAQILKTKGVAKELKERPAIKAALQQPKITKSELEKVAAENPPPEVFEKVDRGPSEAKYRVEHDDVTDRYNVIDDYSDVVRSFRNYDDAESYAYKLGSGTAQYEKWQLPGGKNYREIKLMLPLNKRLEFVDKRINELQPIINKQPIGITPERQEYSKLWEEKELLNKSSGYKSSHFDEPNILAHARVSDRTGPNGEKILHVEEIQSDWHQAGRKKGYAPKDAEAQLKAGEERMAQRGEEIRRLSSRMASLDDTQLDEFNALAAERQRLQDLQGEEIDWGNRIYDARNTGVPDAPFKQNWHELVMKRLLDDAAKKGYDKVIITPGAEQAKRYNLSKYIDSIELHPNEFPNKDSRPYYFIAYNKNQERVADDTVSEKELENYIGKDLANKLLGMEPNKEGGRYLEGANLVSGGEGMKGFYDQMLPAFLNDYGKKWGVKVGTYDLPAGEKMIPDNAGLGMIRSGEQEIIPVHSFDITPQMREDIVGKGQPLYQAIPAGVGAGTLAAPQEEVPEQPMKKGGAVGMDAMRLAVLNKKIQHKAGGGKMEVIKAIGRGLRGMREPKNQTNIIKEGGGNWVAGGVERVLKPLKREDVSVSKPDPLNQWVDKQLTRYIKNQMGTKEDPIRASADKGILHYEPVGWWRRGVGVSARANRKLAGLNTDPISTTPYGMAWENVADVAISGAPYRMHLPMISAEDAPDALRALGGEFAFQNPNALAYSMNKGITAENLGFNHLIDELRNAINPASGLPRELLIKPESLSKLSVPQAVERVAKINEWRAAQKAEADLLRARNPATVLHKEYPEGYSWYELKNPEGAKNSSALEDALKYEGEQMGHCVGGYCPDVAEGRSRIYSLRDKKGQPHVTIEVRPGMTPEEQAARGMREIGGHLNKILQIKGKANLAPKEEYLPFVQDFVRSGNWSDVRDLQNTGLMRVDLLKKEGWDLGDINKKYLTKQEFEDIKRGMDNSMKPPYGSTDEGMKRGGFIKFDNKNIDAMRMAVMNKRLRKRHG